MVLEWLSIKMVWYLDLSWVVSMNSSKPRDDSDDVDAEGVEHVLRLTVMA